MCALLHIYSAIDQNRNQSFCLEWRQFALAAIGCFLFCTFGQSMLPIGRFMPNPAAENKVLPDWLWPIDASHCGQPMVQVTEIFYPSVGRERR